MACPTGSPESSQAPGNKLRLAAAAEALAVFVLIMAYIWRYRLIHPGWWLGILGLVVLSHVIRGEEPAILGFRTRNLRESLKQIAPFLGLSTLILVSYGIVSGTITAVRLAEALAGTVTYSAWGLFQQYLLNGYFARRFTQCSREPAPRAVALLAAALFSMAHAPNVFLMAATLIGGYLSVRFYQRYGNLYALGIAHGVLGVLLSGCLPASLTGHFYIGPRLADLQRLSLPAGPA